jgi:hypothetical protein
VLFFTALAAIAVPAIGYGNQPTSFQALSAEYDRDVRPVLERFCLECHSTDEKQGELDLERFAKLDDVRRDSQVWQKVVEMLDHGEMPPEDSPQPLTNQKTILSHWVARYLAAEALANAGDPGPVVLRRLNNAEYTFTIRDLTGIDSLDPAREFPVDGAAGEGFTNTGNALVMSPSLVQKYLDAAKEIASHAVLLPDGFRFSSGTTRRDWSDEIVADIRAIYRRHTSGDTDTSILDRWSGAAATQSTEDDGRVPLSTYFSAVISNRQRLLESTIRGSAAADVGKAEQDATSPEIEFDELVEVIAEKEQLNAKYLRHLAKLMVSERPVSAVLDSIRQRLLVAAPEDAPALEAEVRAWQAQLWKFNPVGHLGIVQAWQEPVTPLPESVTLRQPIPPDADLRDDPILFLVAGDAGSDDDGDVILLERPRIEFEDRPPILLRDVWSVARRIEESIRTELARTDRYLAAVADIASSTMTIAQIAQARGLNPSLLERWAAYVGLRGRVRRTITGHFTQRLTKVQGYDSINGWGKAATPSLLTNRSDEPISFLTLTIPPRAVTLHPSPTQEAVVHWRSPIDGSIRIRGKIADADDKCGNGATWQVDLLSEFGVTVLVSGVIDNGRDRRFQPDAAFDVRTGDIVSLSVGPRAQDHACDTTHIELQIRDMQGQERVWSLADEIVDDVLEGNPLPDGYGHQDTWHFCTRSSVPEPKTVLPPGSLLDRWRAAVTTSTSKAESERLAEAVQAMLTESPEQPASESDRSLLRQLTDWDGPLDWVGIISEAKAGPAARPPGSSGSCGIDPGSFGRHPWGGSIDAASLVLESPQILEIRLPRALVAGGQFVVRAALDPQAGRDGSVQVRLLTEKPADQIELLPGEPILTRPGQTRERILAAYEEFRGLFPAAMCHARIVPVDEVVTLLLYHREDEHLARLMLGDEEKTRLDRLWDELHYVSQDALRIEVALEQILEFATQDADPRRFDPVREPIAEGAAAFRQRLEQTEEAHLDGLIEFAARAYRRPPTPNDTRRLRMLYRRLRGEDISHQEAFRLALASVLTAPAFLYRIENRRHLDEGVSPPLAAVRNPHAAKAHPVSDWELASRLSYFVCSSMPDEELRAAAASGRLRDEQTILEQTRRLLRDDRARRLAIHFACQWLHIRDFDRLDEKSEQHFPEFASLRDDMYEESIRFFTDLFRNDGSIHSILDADHTFLNQPLATHYGIPWFDSSRSADNIDDVSNDDGANQELDRLWRRFDGVQKFSRGGILAQASTLARQSGASRTSPILRGNWVSETLLGERLPRPPKNVPQLPETVPEGLTERQLIERHTSDAACAKCHARIDPYGFALESYDAIGRFRERDLAGQEIDTVTTLVDGTTIVGLDGLRRYLLTLRHDDFVRHFCRKLLGYALGRAVQLSDEPLLDDMMDQLADKDYRISVAVEAIVLSDQFRKIRAASFNP